MTSSLFEDDVEQARLEVADALNKKYKGAVGVASLAGREPQAPTRIALGAPDLCESQSPV